MDLRREVHGVMLGDSIEGIMGTLRRWKEPRLEQPAFLVEHCQMVIPKEDGDEPCGWETTSSCLLESEAMEWLESEGVEAIPATEKYPILVLVSDGHGTTVFRVPDPGA